MPEKRQIKPRKLPTQGRSRVTVQAIEEAAAHVFCAKGYASGTTNRVAEVAGVSIGSLYQYFPNKESLLLTLASKHLEEGFQLIQTVFEDVTVRKLCLWEMLTEFVTALINLHIKEPKLHRVLFNEAPLPPVFLAEKEAREHEFAKKIASLYEIHPEVAVTNTTIAAYMTVQTVEALVHGFILYPPQSIEVAPFKNELVQMLYQYLSAGGSDKVTNK